ncbi:MAG TPA: SRPBCC family protein [Candidatus Nitrosotenuis sp.]|nr:SRPBCC family protein [Candidatus Nitrosotenuis sp.]
MARLVHSIEIAAPIDRVAAFFVPQRMIYWYGVGMNAELEVLGGAADFADGQKVRLAGRVAGREVSITAVVTRYAPMQMLEWRFRDAHGVRGTQRWDLETARVAGREATRVVMLDDYEFPGRVGKLWDRLVMQHAVARRNRDTLTRLKRLAERSAE